MKTNFISTYYCQNIELYIKYNHLVHRCRKHSLFYYYFFFWGGRGGGAARPTSILGDGVAKCTYTHACIHTCTRMHMLPNVHTMHASTHKHVCMHAHACMHTFIHLYHDRIIIKNQSKRPLLTKNICM